MRTLNLSKFLMLLLSVSIVLSLGSCKKDDDDDNNNNNTTTQPQASNIPPAPSDVDAIAVGLKTVSFIDAGPFGGSIQQDINTAVAAFGDLQAGNFVDVGAVDIDGDVIEKQSNNAYVYTFNGTPGGTGGALGLDFSGNYTWNVTGGSGFTAFDHTVTQSFPSIGEITSSTDNIDASSSYTLSVNDISRADSVIFQIAGTDGNVLVVRPGSDESYTFTASDVASVGTGTAIIQVAAVRYFPETINGKNIWFINETVVTDFVEIQ